MYIVDKSQILNPNSRCWFPGLNSLHSSFSSSFSDSRGPTSAPPADIPLPTLVSSFSPKSIHRFSNETLNYEFAATACYGSDFSQFPTSNLFAAAGEGIWDNGAACGRQYLVRCISSPVPQSCVPGQTIQIRIVDRAQTSSSRPSREGSSIVLSDTAFQTIANPAVNYLNIEYKQ